MISIHVSDRVNAGERLAHLNALASLPFFFRLVESSDACDARVEPDDEDCGVRVTSTDPVYEATVDAIQWDPVVTRLATTLQWSSLVAVSITTFAPSSTGLRRAGVLGSRLASALLPAITMTGLVSAEAAALRRGTYRGALISLAETLTDVARPHSTVRAVCADSNVIASVEWSVEATPSVVTVSARDQVTRFTGPYENPRRAFWKDFAARMVV